MPAPIFRRTTPQNVRIVQRAPQDWRYKESRPVNTSRTATAPGARRPAPSAAPSRPCSSQIKDEDAGCGCDTFWLQLQHPPHRTPDILQATGPVGLDYSILDFGCLWRLGVGFPAQSKNGEALRRSKIQTPEGTEIQNTVVRHTFLP